MKKINIVLFGIGNVGSTFIKQFLQAKQKLEQEKQLQLEIPVIVNSSTAFLNQGKIDGLWKTNFEDFGIPYKIKDITNFVQEENLENLVAIDATASEEFVNNYTNLIENGFHIIAANKVANTLSLEFYEELRTTLKVYNKLFYYETNVGAGLPIIDTLSKLHGAGEKVNRVRGVFSGSLSYIFNTFSEEEKPFSEVLNEAEEKGFTEPDSRVDLSGTDVARKLLILARELQLKQNLEDVKVKNLVPAHLNGHSTYADFQKNKIDLDEGFQQLKADLKPNEVLRYIGELDVENNTLEVKLVSEKNTSPLGALKGADSLFEIYTESYGNQPLVVQGAGAGAAVTARGVFTDLLKLSERIN